MVEVLKAPENDRFQVIAEHDAEDFVFDRNFFGIERSRAVFDWWSSQSALFMRAWSGLAVIFGLFVIYALTPRRQAAA